MKAFAIILRDHPVSEQGWNNLVSSSEQVKNPFVITRHNACTPEQAEERIKAGEVQWNYPWFGEALDPHTGLLKKAYPTKRPAARIACFFSHYDLWKKCIELDTPIFIFEHDAVFIHRLNVRAMNDIPLVLGLNSPFGATRLSHQFDHQVRQSLEEIQKIPRIDNAYVPQGLAGNSAYLITPPAAQAVIKKVGEVGAWPNDALLCYQNFEFLRVSRTYYTVVRQLGSTTSS